MSQYLPTGNFHETEVTKRKVRTITKTPENKSGG